MVVVLIIGILAALALPQITARMRERRANQAAQQIALIYRNARLRAMGRGFSVLVNYNAGTGTFRVLETLPTGCTPSCTAVNWTSATATRQVESFAPIASEADSGVTVTVTPKPGTAPATLLDLCFSPRGRTFSRTVAANALAPMTGTIDVTVGRGANTLQRHVTVLPSGMARLAL